MKFYHWGVVILYLVLASSNTFANQQHSVMKDLENLISQGESASYEKYETIKSKIEREPDVILPQLLSRASNPDLPESSLAIYLWAIGLTKSPKAIDDIIALSADKESEKVESNAYKALASIGGGKSGDYLFKQLDKTSEPMMRYSILDLLAQMQYKQALPKTIEILRQDPNQYYWQTIFVFGKYGDIAVPFLLKKISHEEQNIRINSIIALGQWLIPTEALNPLKNQYWKENNPKIRELILSSLEKVNTDLKEIQNFSKLVIEKETDENVSKFAKETVNNSKKMVSHIETSRANKIQDRKVFEAEYNRILNSFGKEGDYEKLSSSSTIDDEIKLKRLKEIVLQRNSDECFYDYQKINNIIMLNRMI